MTKQEFIFRQNEMSRALSKRSVIWLFGFFGGLVGCGFVSSYVEGHPESYPWFAKLFGIGLLGFLIGMLVLLVVFNQKWQKKFGCRCPACNKPLTGFLVRLAIASGNCGYCGEPVFSQG